MWQCGELKNLIFDQHFLNMDISLNNQHKLLKFCLCALHYRIEGTVSQIFDLGPTFHFMKFRKSNFRRNVSEACVKFYQHNLNIN